MSKIFINHTFKCMAIDTFVKEEDRDDENDGNDETFDIIQYMCSDVESLSTKKLLNQISKTIIMNNMYTGINRNKYNGSLIPTNSKLFSNGSNTNNIPEISLIRDYLEVKLKIDYLNEEEMENDDVEEGEEDDEDDNDNEKLITGHFRFHLPPIIPPQIIILIKSPIPNKLLLFFQGNIKFLNIFTNHIQSKFQCAITDISLNNLFFEKCLNWCIINDKLNSIGTLELWFGKLETKGKLGSIIIKIEENDLLKLKSLVNDNERITSILYEYLKHETSILFENLPLVKIRCQLFTISVDGKIKFSPLMSHLGKTAKSLKNDERLSIWWIIRTLSNNI